MTTEPAVEYDEEFDRHVVELDDEFHSPSELVVYAVSQVSGKEPTALRPLGEVIDPDALDAIFERQVGQEISETHLTFEYEGYEVTLFSHGRLTITEPL